MQIHSSARPGSVPPLRAWAMAARPHTLTISVAPVLVGCAMAWADRGRIDGGVMLLSMLGALLLQTGTNLDNDVSDSERGTDRAGRLGLPRATAVGLLTARQVRAASRACFVLATAVGLVLAWLGGWPILVAGLAAAAAAMGYSGGPRPISYTPFGDVVVWLFFGAVAVGGTYWLQTGSLSVGAAIAATMVGFPATAVLVVNNYRDLVPDAQVGKRTLAVCMGRAFTRWEYALLMLCPFAMLVALAAQARSGAGLIAAWLLPLLSLPMAWRLVRRFWSEAPGPAFNEILARTAKFQVVFSMLLCGALLLG